MRSEERTDWGLRLESWLRRSKSQERKEKQYPCVVRGGGNPKLSRWLCPVGEKEGGVSRALRIEGGAKCWCSAKEIGDLFMIAM